MNWELVGILLHSFLIGNIVFSFPNGRRYLLSFTNKNLIGWNHILHNSPLHEILSGPIGEGFNYEMINYIIIYLSLLCIKIVIIYLIIRTDVIQ